jgi:flagellar hook-length control protein FliK
VRADSSASVSAQEPASFGRLFTALTQSADAHHSNSTDRSDTEKQAQSQSPSTSQESLPQADSQKSSSADTQLSAGKTKDPQKDTKTKGDSRSIPVNIIPENSAASVVAVPVQIGGAGTLPANTAQNALNGAIDPNSAAHDPLQKLNDVSISSSSGNGNVSNLQSASIITVPSASADNTVLSANTPASSMMKAITENQLSALPANAAAYAHPQQPVQGTADSTAREASQVTAQSLTPPDPRLNQASIPFVVPANRVDAKQALQYPDNVLKVDAAPMRAGEPETPHQSSVLIEQKVPVTNPNAPSGKDALPAQASQGGFRGSLVETMQQVTAPQGSTSSKAAEVETAKSAAVDIPISFSSVHTPQEETGLANSHVAISKQNQSSGAVSRPEDQTSSGGLTPDAPRMSSSDRMPTSAGSGLASLSHNPLLPAASAANSNISLSTQSEKADNQINPPTVGALLSGSLKEAQAGAFQKDGGSGQSQDQKPDNNQMLSMTAANAFRHSQTTSAPVDSASPVSGSADRVETAQQAIRQIETMRITQGKQEVTVHLHPDSLGEMQMTITADRSSLHARIVTQTEHAYQAIDEHRDQLSNALESKGFTLQGLDVSLQNNTSGQGFHPFFRDQAAPIASKFQPQQTEAEIKQPSAVQVQRNSYRSRDRLDYSA